ncbi:MAG: cytochrome c oxidase assembly protein [Alphaproteobacteria bacterium]
MTTSPSPRNGADRGNAAMRRGNMRVMLTLVGVVVAMVGLSFAAVPAYRAFCQAFGFAGTPLRADAGETGGVQVLDRTITVRFNADTDPGLPWHFRPAQGPMTLRVGESGLAFYKATNNGDRPITGTATFNVVPLKAAPYFVKVDCFCFTEQTLAPGESVDMPVTFYVDPAIAEDGNLDEVGQVTLSYTFYRDVDADAEQQNRTAALSGAVSSVN